VEHCKDGSRLGVKLRHWGAAVVLELEGRLTAQVSGHALGDLTEWVAGGGHSLLVLDLSGVSQMDCCGIGQLVRLHEKVKRLGVNFALVRMERRQKHLLRMAGLLTVLPVFDSPREALSWFDGYDVA
jgi:anti-anti-sigma factor